MKRHLAANSRVQAEAYCAQASPDSSGLRWRMHFAARTPLHRAAWMPSPVNGSVLARGPRSRNLHWAGGSGTASGGVFEQPGFAPAQISPDVNPQITGSDGRYGWNVVTGCWYVIVTAPGYASKTSALVGVPPEVTDLDLTLDALNLPNKIYLPLVLK